jgi:cell division control protein 6
VIGSEPKQHHFVLYSIILLTEERKNDPFFTGDVYNLYQSLCQKNKMDILTQRRVSDIVQEFDMLGIINVNVISKGRGGRMREIKLAISKEIIGKAKELIENSI